MNKNLKYILGASLFGVFAVSLWALYPSTLGANPGDPAQVALGQQIYGENCASCHGENLEGETTGVMETGVGFDAYVVPGTAEADESRG